MATPLQHDEEALKREFARMMKAGNARATRRALFAAVPAVSGTIAALLTLLCLLWLREDREEQNARAREHGGIVIRPRGGATSDLLSLAIAPLGAGVVVAGAVAAAMRSRRRPAQYEV